MANVQTDFLTGSGPFVSRATDTDGNAAVTVTVPDPGDGQTVKIYKITATCSGATAAADGTILVKLDNSATNFKVVLAAVRGGLADLDFLPGLAGLKSTAVPVVLSSLGASCVGELEVVWDLK